MTTLYRFFDADDALLYVGITDRHVVRWVEHSGSKPWWPDVARVAVEHHNNRAAALEAERTAIKAEHPRHNVVHAGKRCAAPRARANRITWTCDVCGGEIHGGGDEKGWLTVDHPRAGDLEAWKILHARCDPNERASYWFDVERIRTRDHLDEWNRHLREKEWVQDQTDWHAISGMAFEQLEGAAS